MSKNLYTLLPSFSANSVDFSKAKRSDVCLRDIFVHFDLCFDCFFFYKTTKCIKACFVLRSGDRAGGSQGHTAAGL